MKKATVILLTLLLSLSSCDSSDLDLLEDPNDVTLEKADLNRFLNKIQLDFANFTRQMGRNAAQATRVEYMFGRDYNNVFEPANLDGEWTLAYQNMFSDIAAAEKIAEADEANKHLAVMKILKAYTSLMLVDYFGDIPFSEAANSSEFPAPNADAGANVYEEVIALLNEGIRLASESGDSLENDFYYNNDFNKWIKLANTIKMQAYANTRLVDGEAISKFLAIANNPQSYISNVADDFQFRYGTNEANPDTRHPGYVADYGTNGVSRYRSNWLMNTMLQNDDPRRRYYFYRQVDCTPGAPGCPPNTQRLPCSVAPTPFHYSNGMIFCSVEDGYWGRDHGNDEGLPQDGLQKTAGGLYPYGGRFDGDEFSSVGIGIGGAGAGIVPIMLSSYSQLMIAEVHLANNNSGAATNALSAALEASLDKVVSFTSLDPEANEAFVPSITDQANFVNRMRNEFQNSATERQWEILGNQTLVTNYGNGHLGYNFYRRTGYPFQGFEATHALQFNIEANPGTFLRSFLYPAIEANVNSNIVQKQGVSVQVFWDTNPASPGFPRAN